MTLLIFVSIFKVHITKYWNGKVPYGLRDRNLTLEKRGELHGTILNRVMVKSIIGRGRC